MNIVVLINNNIGIRTLLPNRYYIIYYLLATLGFFVYIQGVLWCCAVFSFCEYDHWEKQHNTTTYPAYR